MTGARIFISYRTSDGMDKATALARDLGRVFGDEAVFLDKDDLRGGSAWRAEVGRTLDGRPALLLLLTRDLLGARDAEGLLRIADPADPVRRELETALEAGASIIPVLCDGLDAPPDARHLPAPFHHIGELTWRKLRAYDWAHDVERLVGDLKALEVPPLQATPAANPGAATGPAAQAPAAIAEQPTTQAAARRATVALLAAAGVAVMLWWSQRAPVTPPQANAPPAATVGGEPLPTVGGRWSAVLWQGERVNVVLTQTGSTLALASEPIDIAQRPDWIEYRKSWREQTGRSLDAVMYRGEGRLVADPGQAPAVDIALQVRTVPDSTSAVDGGNLSATLSPDGQHLTGTIWLNGSQSEQPATLERETPK